MQKVKDTVKRVLACALVMVMVLSYAPDMAFAQDTMSEEFASILNEDGKFVMYSVIPESEEDVMLLFQENEIMWDKYPDYGFDEFSDDYKSCVITNWQTEESHEVEIVYVYDEAVISVVDELIKKIPQGEYNEEYDYYDPYLFEVKDMELVQYWVNGGGINDLISYSDEFKALIGYKNFRIDCRRGDDPPFYTMADGFAPFMNNGSVYGFANIGVKANHAIFVPDETGDTPEELKAAVLKRIEEYIGAGKVEIIGYDTNPLDLMLVRYDESIAYAEEQLANAQSNVAQTEEIIAQCIAKIEEYEAMRDSDPAYYDECIAQEEETKAMYESNLENDMMSLGYAEEWVESAINAKQEYIDEYNAEDGKNYYLNEAAGDYYFTAEINEMEYNFVVIKDSDRMVTPEYKSSDVKTGVTVDSKDSSIPLDTLISVEELTSGKTYEDIMSVLGIDNGKSFDINLFSQTLDKYITKLANGKFKVRIPIGAEYDGKILKVYYVDENKKVQEYEVTVEGKEAVFVTDHFSIYTLAAEDNALDGEVIIPEPDTTPEEDISPGTGDVSNMWLMYVVIILSAAVVCYIKAKRKVNI